MSQQQFTSLLWINKDASNVHRKKHVAEVNAHVQKSSSRKRQPKKASIHKKPISTRRKLSVGAKSEPSPGFHSDSSQSGHDNEPRLKSEHSELSETASVGSVGDGAARNNSSTPNALIFSSYLEDGGLQATDVTSDESNSLDFHADVEELTRRLELSLPASLDASNPMPGLVTDMPDYDKMLIHTHLTYMPQMFYGLSTHAAYCPIRNASVINMLKAPVGFLWVLVSLEMYLETARKSNARKAVILQRKNHAYQLMAQALDEQSCATDQHMLLGSTAAAITELFCGDPAKALTHLNGIDALITNRGGMEYVKQLDSTTSMPVFAVLAYRTLLQDNLTNYTSFERARSGFMHHLRSLLIWNLRLKDTLVVDTHIKKESSPHDEGFNDDFDLADSFRELQEARHRAFLRHPILSKFITADFTSNKPGERVDHFILLFNLNRIIADHGTNFKQAIQFIENLVNDTELGGSTRGANSSIKVSGVLRLLTNRLSKMFPAEPSVGVVHAWDALDALEIMKLLSSEMRSSVFHTLHALLVGDNTSIMTDAQLAAMGSLMTAEWQARHPRLSFPLG